LFYYSKITGFSQFKDSVKEYSETRFYDINMMLIFSKPGPKP